MPPGSDVGLVAQDPVGAPRHHMCGAGRDRLSASRTHVGLLRTGTADGLDEPGSVSMVLGAFPPCHQPFETVTLVVAGPWPVAVVSGHGSSLGSASTTVSGGGSGQYQPLDSEWAHAPHGVLYRLVMYPRPQVICVAGLVAQSAPAEAILEPGSACGIPVAPELAL